jgi:hypothetical protein
LKRAIEYSVKCAAEAVAKDSARAKAAGTKMRKRRRMEEGKEHTPTKCLFRLSLETTFFLPNTHSGVAEGSLCGSLVPTR